MRHHRLQIVDTPTPLSFAHRLSEEWDIELSIKRDDLAGPTMGGNKSRQLEYYFGDALNEDADAILITGAVQSNFARLAVAVANSIGMRPIVQLEDRVPGKSSRYRETGNVLLAGMMNAEIMTYPEGEDEEGADAALHIKADALTAAGSKPYIIHLSEGHAPLGALGYVDAASEIMAQQPDFDVFVVASGSGSTHAGLLAGLRGADSRANVFGSCTRRDATAQASRIRRVVKRLDALYPRTAKVTSDDIVTWDGAFWPGYGQINEAALGAMRLAAELGGLILDPVYTAKSFAAIPALVASGEIPKGSKVCFIHAGGLAALFAYDESLSTSN